MKKIQYAILFGSILTAGIAGCGFGRLMSATEASANSGDENLHTEELLGSDINAKNADNAGVANTEVYNVSKVAIVNLDEGIKNDEKTTYYAKQLLNIKDSVIFEYCSLEEAKTGIDNGEYAGYIVIPAEFSTNVTSINEVPTVSEIDYVLSEKVTDKCKYEALLNINELSNDLNNDLSYMYLESLMAEVHTVQDNAQEVMDNDLSDKEIIDKIKSSDLISLVELPEMKTVENNTKSADSSSYNNSNASLMNQLNSKYDSLEEEANGERTKVEDKGNTLSESLDGFGNQTNDVKSILKDGDKDLDTEVKEDVKAKVEEVNSNISSVKKEVNDYASSISSNATSVKDNYNSEIEYLSEEIKTQNGYMRDIKKYVPCVEFLRQKTDDGTSKLYLTYSESAVKSAREYYCSDKSTETPKHLIAESQTMREEKAVVVQWVLSQMENYIIDLNSHSSTDAANPTLDGLCGFCADYLPFENISKEYEGITKDELYKIINDPSVGSYEAWKFSDNLNSMEDFNSFLPGEIEEYSKKCTVNEEIFAKSKENIKSMTSDIEGINKSAEKKFSNIKTEEITGIIDNKYFKKIRTNEGEVRNQYIGIFNSAKTDVEEYNKVLKNSKFSMDTSFSADYLSKISENNSNIVADAMDSNSSYAEYASNVMQANSENIEAIRTNIQNANETAKKTVEDGLSEAKNVKNTNSDKNQEALLEITKKLQYTRIGSLENQNVYEFIANPVDVSGEAIVSNTTSSVSNENVEKKAEKPKIITTEEKKATSTTTKNAQNILLAIVISVVVIAILLLAVMRYLKKKKNNWD